MFIENRKPYKNCRIYGEYTSKKDKRKRVVIIFPNKKKITVSYPKYLVEVNIGRLLKKNETVDHQDRNIDNNDIGNLIIRDRIDHIVLDAKRIRDVNVICSYCKKPFIISGKKIGNRGRRKNKKLIFCSRRCVGLYGSDVQNNKPLNVIENEISREYYYLEK